MSDYCTNCIYLQHGKGENYSWFICCKNNYNLISLCGNPFKQEECKNKSWYTKKAEAQPKQCELEHMECDIIFSRVTGEPESLSIVFDPDNRKKLVDFYKKGITKLFITR